MNIPKNKELDNSDKNDFIHLFYFKINKIY